MRRMRSAIRLCAVCLLLSFAGCSVLSGKKAAPKPADAPAAAAAVGCSQAAVAVPARQGTQPEARGTQKPEVRRKFRWQDWLFFWWPKPKPRPPQAAPLETSGVVSFVNLPGNFVILESPKANLLPVGLVLSSVRDGRIVARVKVTEDRRPPFVIAEILEGSPARGDRFHPVVIE